MKELELWVFRIFGGFMATIGGILGGDYLLNVRAGDLFRKKVDCEKLYEQLYKENREDHEKMNKKLESLLKSVSRIEGKLKCNTD